MRHLIKIPGGKAQKTTTLLSLLAKLKIVIVRQKKYRSIQETEDMDWGKILTQIFRTYIDITCSDFESKLQKFENCGWKTYDLQTITKACICIGKKAIQRKLFLKNSHEGVHFYLEFLQKAIQMWHDFALSLAVFEDKTSANWNKSKQIEITQLKLKV